MRENYIQHPQKVNVWGIFSDRPVGPFFIALAGRVCDRSCVNWSGLQPILSQLAEFVPKLTQGQVQSQDHQKIILHDP